MTSRAMRYRINPFRQAPIPSTPSSARAFHASLPGYRPTPLHQLPGLAAALDLGRVYVKDESQRFGLQSFKALGASWAVHRLLRSGPAPTTLATATDGNHGRAVAWAARTQGLDAVIFLTTHAAPARVERIRAEGARVVRINGTYEDAVRACAERSAVEGWAVVADVGYEGYLEIPAWIAEGYRTLGEELDQQLDAAGAPPPDVAIVQAGVGGLAAGMVAHFASRPPAPRVAVVEPVEADALLESIGTPDGAPAPSRGTQRSLMAGLNCGEVSLTAWPLLRRSVDLFCSVTDAYAMEAMRRLAHPRAGDPPIEAGEAGAAGLAGLLALLRHEPFAPARAALGLSRRTAVLLLNTEGATDPEGWSRIVAGGAPTP